MIVTVFSPAGIVTATSDVDVFYENFADGDCLMQKRIAIEGFTHTYLFWNKYSLVYKSLDQFSFNSNLEIELEKISNKWHSVPSVTEFMTQIKKMISETNIQFVGIMSTYDYNDDNVLEQFVFQILGDNIRRVNLDANGQIDFNCIYLEKNPCVGRLLQNIKLRNGDDWMETNQIQLCCNLYSIPKSIDLCKFLVKTNHYMDDINCSTFDSPLKMQVSIVTKDKIEMQNIII